MPHHQQDVHRARNLGLHQRVSRMPVDPGLHQLPTSKMRAGAANCEGQRLKPSSHNLRSGPGKFLGHLSHMQPKHAPPTGFAAFAAA